MSDNTLQNLLDQGKFDEAKRYMESIFVANDQDSENKDEKLSMVSAYIGALNEANEDYIAVLDDALIAMKDVDASEKENISTHKIMEVRSKLNS